MSVPDDRGAGIKQLRQSSASAVLAHIVVCQRAHVFGTRFYAVHRVEEPVTGLGPKANLPGVPLAVDDAGVEIRSLSFLMQEIPGLRAAVDLSHGVPHGQLILRLYRNAKIPWRRDAIRLQTHLI